RALKAGASLGKIFKTVSAIRKKTGIPVAFMTYYNPVLHYGLPGFFESCARHGVDGVIIPDLPAEEAKEIIDLGRKNKVSTIFLAAPTSTRKRIINITKSSSGFIYYVSLTGVTGVRSKLPTELKSKVRLIKSITDKPVAVGFGVSTAAQAKEIARVADGVIVGSAIVKIIGEKKDIINRVSRFVKALAKAIHNV
ncbi:MAG: tryptophan synthase subunit alpha, partial [Candidatus Omnitrophota bacterium]|nr:tryptophan synthase subunit alpha [Candidatus Omnitrophota bacterium]